MNPEEKKPIKVAILDLYEGVPNQGMRCIREILNQYGEANHLDLQWDEFEVRQKLEIPEVSEYDIFISSGGPGSPLDSEGSEWEKKYFDWLNALQNRNADTLNQQKKFAFFICHSFQLICRYYKLAVVSKRKSTSFGVFPMHVLDAGINENIFEGLDDPFYAVDSRDYQVTSPNYAQLAALRSSILCIEKERPHIPLERAIMAVRFNDYMVGTQFHPEADAIGMSMYLQQDDKKKSVIEAYGEAKWASMIEQLNDPDKILWTYAHVLPNFLNHSIEHLQAVVL
ncbi:MAG: GMP synthase [Terrimonas sp.]|uniref:type 1 glutamine amidotransferase n=1 Tax=Terrimonas sp. TaxID=1914338 RepID=UPI000925B8E6|nr:GMP synthase [Terrimonas sp.]MBN8788859.1 GMP synthase [Terrimonas sp.]OJY95780.1 MAG: GMP synthase [Sphingobacteriales bacterium 40-81]PVD51322.1 GMP synthase [Terrimonas sp.]